MVVLSALGGVSSFKFGLPQELVVEMMSLGGLANRRCDTQEVPVHGLPHQRPRLNTGSIEATGTSSRGVSALGGCEGAGRDFLQSQETEGSRPRPTRRPD